MARSTLHTCTALAVMAGLSWAAAASAQTTTTTRREATSHQTPGSSSWGRQVTADAARLHQARSLANLINDGKCDQAVRRVSDTEDSIMILRVNEACTVTHAATLGQGSAKP
jgi:hypothetical protein